MAELWPPGCEAARCVVAAWKDVLVLGALVARRSAAPAPAVDGVAADWLAVAFSALVVLYALRPAVVARRRRDAQGRRSSRPTRLLPVAAYFLGRGLDLTSAELPRLWHGPRRRGRGRGFGLVDVYASRFSGGATTTPPAGSASSSAIRLRGSRACRRTSSTTPGTERASGGSPRPSSRRSPRRTCSSSALFVPRRRRAAARSRPAVRGASLDAHARGRPRARLGLLVLAGRAPARLAARRRGSRRWSSGFAVIKELHDIGPRTHFTPRARSAAREAPPARHTTPRRRQSEHLSEPARRDRDRLHHPWGYGLGNAGGRSATHVPLRAGESTYTELGVETGLLGALVFVAWSLAMLRRWS